MIKKNHSQ